MAIDQKSFLFFGSEKGDKTAATLYTLVQSAQGNCVDVWPYLTDVLRRIQAIAPGDTKALDPKQAKAVGVFEAELSDEWEGSESGAAAGQS